MKNLNEMTINFNLIDEINDMHNLEKLCETYADVSKQIDDLCYNYPKRNKYYFAQMNFLHAVRDFTHIRLKQMINHPNVLPF